MANQSKIGKWVLVTGASAGIGETFVRRFAGEGWHIVLVARSKDKLEALARELEGRNGIKTRVIVSDLRERGSAQQVYDQVRKAEIPLEGLVNNAGISVGGHFSRVPVEKYLAMIDLNVRALVELTGLFLPDMVKRGSGLIVNVSSTAAYQPMPYSSIYGATKSFVTSFTEALWLETKGTGVRVLNLCPGVTKTDFGTTAGLHDFKKDPIAEDPERVVETAFRAFHNGKPTVISGWKNRMLVGLERFVPHRLLLAAVLQYQKMRERM